MHHKSIAYRIIIDLEYASVSASDHIILRDAVDHFNDIICTKLAEIGISSDTKWRTNISKVNGGYAIRNKFKVNHDIVTAMLMIDVMSGDHPSKPDISTKSMQRLDNDLLNHKNCLDVDIEDTYCSRSDKGDIIYYVGKGDTYSSPVSDEDVAANVVVRRISNFLSEKLSQYADAALHNYKLEAVSLATDYVSETCDLQIFYDDGNDIEIEDPESTLADLHETYVLTGFELDAIDSGSEFDEICEIVRLKYLY